MRSIKSVFIISCEDDFKGRLCLFVKLNSIALNSLNICFWTKIYQFFPCYDKSSFISSEKFIIFASHIYCDVTTIFSKVVVAFHENEQISVVWEMTNFGYNLILLIAPKLLCLLQISSMIITKIYLLQFTFKLQ